MNVAIISGELSGDLIGAGLAEALRSMAPDVRMWGLGSAAMRAAGVELLADSAGWGVISITQAIGKYPALRLSVLPRVQKALRTRRPDVVVLIDFGAFNVRVARDATALGLKVLYYFPPGSWRRTGTSGSGLARRTNLLAVPFPWAADRYRLLGANAVYVGHPLRERVHTSMTRAEFAAHFGMDPSAPIVGLLPGSRHHEVSFLMPVLLDAARLIHDKVPNAQFVVGIAPNISPESMAGYLSGHRYLLDRLGDVWHEFAQEAETRVLKQVARTATALAPGSRRKMVTVAGVVVEEDALGEELARRKRVEQLRQPGGLPPTVLAKGMTYEVMAHSDVLLTCSGTATLEAAVFTTPMVILYKFSKIMELEGRLRGLHRKIRFIGMPNILADRSIVPELIQNAATPDAIARHALEMLNDVEIRHRVRTDLEAVREMLGTPGASRRTARLVLELANRLEGSHEPGDSIEGITQPAPHESSQAFSLGATSR